MAREVRIKVKNQNGDLESKKVELPADHKISENLDLFKKNSKTIIRETREYELITPLFGGGVGPKHADEVSVVRTTEIRGHLRFWWRATCGGQFATTEEELKKHEDAIFGSTDNHSALQIGVLSWNNQGEDSPFEIVSGSNNKPKVRPRNGSEVPSYAAFPLQPQTKGLKTGQKTDSVTTGVRFKILVSFLEEHEKDIRTSFWAWETFGGIGGRTRRGFGALNLLKINDEERILPKTADLQELIEKNLKTSKECLSLQVPRLTDNTRFQVTKKSNTAIDAWKHLINKLKKFRQFRKDKYGNLSDYGKSQWPEPNALRYRMGKGTKPHIDKFPRSQFGLPIIFHMPQPFDDFEVTLKGKGAKDKESIERLASPLILRPIKCADGCVGIALVLNTPLEPPHGLFLTDIKVDIRKGGKSDVFKKNDVPEGSLTESEAKELTKKLGELNNKTDVLQAFLDYLEK